MNHAFHLKPADAICESSKLYCIIHQLIIQSFEFLAREVGDSIFASEINYLSQIRNIQSFSMHSELTTQLADDVDKLLAKHYDLIMNEVGTVMMEYNYKLDMQDEKLNATKIFYS